jgi:hypothetical protein
MSKTPTHQRWWNMLQRCENPASPQWPHYGGRGIKVCERWRSFAAFFADMGEAPAGMSIERIDNDGDYEPGNCRWATQREQLLNTRRNRIIEFNGVSAPLCEWAQKIGVHPSTLHRRLLSWPIEKALTKLKHVN